MKRLRAGKQLDVEKRLVSTEEAYEFIEYWEGLRGATDPSRDRAVWPVIYALEGEELERLKLAAERFYMAQDTSEPKYIMQLKNWLSGEVWKPLLSESWRAPKSQEFDADKFLEGLK